MPITFRASGNLDHADEWAGACVTLDTSTALDLLTFIGLDRDAWGACEGNDLAARLRRAMWPSRRAPNSLVPYLVALLDLAQRAPGGLVVFDDERAALQ